MLGGFCVVCYYECCIYEWFDVGCPGGAEHEFEYEWLGEWVDWERDGWMLCVHERFVQVEEHQFEEYYYCFVDLLY